MSRYVVFVYLPAPGDWSQVPPEELGAYGSYPAEVEALGGKHLGGEALSPVPPARSVEGDVVVEVPAASSGSGEVLAAFDVIEAPDLEHAIAIARLSPATRHGRVELRPALP